MISIVSQISMEMTSRSQPSKSIGGIDNLAKPPVSHTAGLPRGKIKNVMP